MAQIHLIEGPVGAGKSTYAARVAFEHHTIHLDLDAWMVALFSPDRPTDGFMDWYTERKRRCTHQIWQVATELLESGQDVVLELGLVQRIDRHDFYARVDATDWPLTIHLLEVPYDQRLARVRARNQGSADTFKMVVTDEVFDLANRAWEPPDERELAQRDFRLIGPGQTP